MQIIFKSLEWKGATSSSHQSQWLQRMSLDTLFVVIKGHYRGYVSGNGNSTEWYMIIFLPTWNAL